MDLATAQYIVDYHRHLQTEDEASALRHRSMFRTKAETDQLIIEIANRILREYPRRVFLNICPRCAKLARSPQARQCRFCYYSWHHHTVATIKPLRCTQAADQSFYLIANVVSGSFSKGNYLDLTMVGINYQPKIVAFEYIPKTDIQMTEDIGFLVDELPPEERIRLEKAAVSNTIVPIITEKRV